MEIWLGAEVSGPDGKLGKIERFFIDPKSQRAEQMTIRRLFGGEHVVSLLRVTGVEQGQVKVDLDQRGLEAMSRFDEQAYRAPGFKPARADEWQQELDLPVAHEIQPGSIEPPIGESMPARTAQGAPEFTPEDEQEPVISHDTDIFAMDGEKLGKVARFAVDSVTGQPTALALRRGVLQTDFDIPLDQVKEYGPEGIVTRLSQEQMR